MQNESSGCPVDAVLRLLAGPWTTHVLWTLQTQGELRFGALRRAIPGISSRLLAERLRRLMGAGFILRDCQPTVPPQVSYRLSERGRRLGEVLALLEPVARSWASESSAPTDEETLAPGARRACADS